MQHKPIRADELAFIFCVVVVGAGIAGTALHLGWVPPSLGPAWLDLACWALVALVAGW
jgi:hypothetical protein